MQYNKFRHLITLVVTLSIVLSMSISVSADSYISSSSYSSVFTPADSEIIPIDDGTKIIEHTPFWDFYFWKAKVMLFFDSLWNDTPYQHFIRTVVIPLVSAALGIILFVVLFSRKNPDCLSPTATIIIAFLKENPISTEVTIRKGVGKSRGAVSYQLHRLLFDGKIYSAEICGKTCYSTSPILADAPETAVHFLRNSRQQAEIISYLCSHPWATRKEIADGTSRPVDSVRYHLKNIDVGILQKGIREDAEIYAVEEWAEQLWDNH